MIYANKKNGQIKHQTEMIQTRLFKTNIRVNWVKGHVQACDLDFDIFEKCVFVSKMAFSHEK